MHTAKLAHGTADEGLETEQTISSLLPSPSSSLTSAPPFPLHTLIQRPQHRHAQVLSYASFIIACILSFRLSEYLEELFGLFKRNAVTFWTHFLQFPQKLWKLESSFKRHSTQLSVLYLCHKNDAVWLKSWASRKVFGRVTLWHKKTLFSLGLLIKLQFLVKLYLQMK